MPKLVMLFLILFTVVARAQTDGSAQKWRSNVAFGKSVPKSAPDLNILPQNTSFEPGDGPTRIDGGEVITVEFVDPSTHKPTPVDIDNVALIGFSSSDKGGVLVRSATSNPKQPAGFFDPLVKFQTVTSPNKTHERQGLVLLNNEDSVSIAFPKPTSVSSLQFTVEGFTNNDASLVVQFIYSSANPKVTEMITREIVNPPSEGGGGGGGGSNEWQCYSSIQCSSLQNCIGGQCVDVSNHDCRVSSADACEPGESCCGGKCVTGNCD